MSDTTLIMVGMILGGIFGLSFPQLGQSISFLGDIFLNLIQMSLGFLILGQVIAAVAKINIRKLGKLGTRTIAVFFSTVLLSTVWGVLWSVIFKPGAGMDLSTQTSNGVVDVENQSIIEVILGFFPDNIFESLTNGTMMQITVFALVFGAALSLLNSEKEFKFMNLLDEFNRIILKMMGIVMKIAPIGVFALIANAMGTYGVDIFGPLIQYILVFLGAIISYMILWILIVAVYTKESPLQIGKQLLSMSLLAFASNSSAVILPTQIKDSREKLGMSSESASFMMPLGMSLNSPGSALHNAMVLVIAGQMYGMSFSFGDYITVIFIATFASYATAVIPGGGVVALNIVLPQMGFGADVIGFFATVDYPTGMFRTTANVQLDATAGMVVAKSIGELDHDVLNGRRPAKE